MAQAAIGPDDGIDRRFVCSVETRALCGSAIATAQRGLRAAYGADGVWVTGLFSGCRLDRAKRLMPLLPGRRDRPSLRTGEAGPTAPHGFCSIYAFFASDAISLPEYEPGEVLPEPGRTPFLRAGPFPA